MTGSAPRIGISGTEYIREPDGLGMLLADASAVGAEGLEVWYPENFSTGVESSFATLAGAPVTCVASGSELGKEDPAADIELLRAAITAAHRLDAPFANTYFGPPGWYDDTRTIDRYARAVTGCLDHAASLGITVVLENEFDAFGHDPEHADPSRRPESLRRLVDLVGHPAFGLNFDAANMVCAGVDDVFGAFDLLQDAVRYAHVKDVIAIADRESVLDGWTAYRDGDRWYSTCPLGTGLVPWDRLLPKLAARVPTLTLEPHSGAEGRTAAYVQAMKICRGMVTA